MKSNALSVAVQTFGDARRGSSRLQLFAVSLRIVIGALFCLSGLLKVINRTEFMNALISYGLFSSRMIHLAVLVIPQIEILLGALLAFGLGTRKVCWLLALLTVIFTLVSAVAFAQGTMADCGCFPIAGATEMIGIGYFIRNASLILACLLIGFRFRESEGQG